VYVDCNIGDVHDVSMGFGLRDGAAFNGLN
jgi:hypothetical protein